MNWFRAVSRTSKNCTRLSPAVTSRSPVSHLEIQAGARQVPPEVPTVRARCEADCPEVRCSLPPPRRSRCSVVGPPPDLQREISDVPPDHRALPTDACDVMLPVTLMLPRLRCYIETSGTARWIASHSSPNSISSQKSGAAFISSPWAERASSVTACLPEHRSAEETLTQPKTGRVTRRGASRQRSAAALATTETECSSTACSGRQRRG